MTEVSNENLRMVTVGGLEIKRAAKQAIQSALIGAPYDGTDRLGMDMHNSLTDAFERLLDTTDGQTKSLEPKRQEFNKTRGRFSKLSPNDFLVRSLSETVLPNGLVEPKTMSDNDKMEIPEVAVLGVTEAIAPLLAVHAVYNVPIASDKGPIAIYRKSIAKDPNLLILCDTLLKEFSVSGDKVAEEKRISPGNLIANHYRKHWFKRQA